MGIINNIRELAGFSNKKEHHSPKVWVMLFLFFLLLTYHNASSQEKNNVFDKIYASIQHQNYFAARDLYSESGDKLPELYRNYTEAVLDNAFNRCEDSEKKILLLLHSTAKLPDSLKYKIQRIKTDNEVKLYRYSDAAKTTTTILSDYKNILTLEEANDFKNSLKIWKTLENTAPQKIEIQGDTKIRMTKDIAGLNNLTVTAKGQQADFIFDTGANLSTISETVANRFGMKVFPTEIEVGSITGKTVLAHLAVCEELLLQNIVMHNVIFLVMPDKALSFDQINYQIKGILGYPVIEALKEIQITRDGDFIVPAIPHGYVGNANMALAELTPIVNIEGKPFSLDTGADHTSLYHAFYTDNKEEIQQHYAIRKIKFGGAGGVTEVDGYVISHTFNLDGHKTTLENLQLVIDKSRPEETLYGNIGQDLIRQFSSMTLNFKYMFLKFE
jgi:predicted aspartyl protease